MSGPPPATARVRVAVRRQLSDVDSGGLVLVACSGGPDSMALAAACGFVAPRLGLRAGLATVDHGLQDGSDRRAADLAAWARGNGFDPVESVAVDVDPADGGTEAAARAARYAALDRLRRNHSAAAIVLGHTLDDQAETVLLALARGSGPRGIAAMPARRGGLRRPLLSVRRTDTRESCAELGLPIWDDPHNSDPRFLRAGLRAALPALTEALGERLIPNLARTAGLIADDLDALDRYAARALDAARHGTLADTHVPNLRLGELASVPRAVRTRALRAWVLEEGADADGLFLVHIEALDALVTAWKGQGPVQLPGGVEVRRERNRLWLTPTTMVAREGQEAPE